MAIPTHIEHIGIAVKDIETAKKYYEEVLGLSCYKVEEVVDQKVITAFFQVGQTKIELLESTDPEGPIGKYISKKGEGIHHIAFEVADIEKEMARLREEGFQLINEAPKKGADNKLVAFIHPKSTNGVLVELCQEIK